MFLFCAGLFRRKEAFPVKKTLGQRVRFRLPIPEPKGFWTDTGFDEADLLLGRHEPGRIYRGPSGESDWIVPDPEVDFAALFARFRHVGSMGRRTFELTQSPGAPTMPGVVAGRRVANATTGSRPSATSR